MKIFAARFTAFALLAVSIVVSTAHAGTTPVDLHGALSISGNLVVDQHGKPVALSGVSFFWSNDGWGQERFYSASAVDYFAKDWNASLVRAAIGADGGGGYGQDPKANMVRLEALIDAAVKDGIYVLVDWHSHHAEQNPAAAIAFFTAVATKYGHVPNVIYEIYNEPLNTADWSTMVKPYAEKVIDSIRAVDPNNLIIVGTPTWSQDVDIAASNPIQDRKNIAYTLHFYAGSHKADLRKKAKAARDAGIALFVTEWGTVNADGDGPVATEEVNTWFGFLKDNCLSNANWSVSDKKEGASIFKPGVSLTGPITDQDLTPSGLLARDLVRHWSSTCD